MGLIKLREEVHNKFLKLKTVDMIINGMQFERLWNDSNDQQKQKVLDLIDKLDTKGVRKWVREHASLDLTELPTLKLRDIAKRLQVPNYSRLDKLSLVRGIQERERDSNEKNKERTDS